ncbi:LysR family transcriptional regulator [Staphylococcus taiwanensis]|nr:LysR family transcriptional regulator [Staphylococcus taiwanensis]
MRKIEIIKLKYFKVVAEMNNITQASKRLNISQPALSKAISSLEDDIGVKLFDRKGRQIFLNQYGKLMLNYVNNAFEELNEGERVVRALTGIESGQVTFAITFPHVMPSLIQIFLSQHPDLKIKQYQANSDDAKQLILDNKVDCAISSSPIEHEDIVWEPIIKDDIYLTVSKTHPLATFDSIELQQIENDRLIGQIKGYGFRDTIDDILEREGIRPNYQIEVEDSSAILKLVAMNIGISFTPKQALMQLNSQVVAIPIKNKGCYRMIGIAYKQSHYFTEVATSFKTFVTQYFRELNN